MKKKIAVFANGWSDEFIQTVLSGMRECARENKVDVYVFADFSTGDNSIEDIGEANIFNLPDLGEFDGCLLLANTFNLQWALDLLTDRIIKSGLPAISLEYEVEGLDYMGTENYHGMYELTTHMIEIHGKKEILFVGGQKQHEESRIRKQAVEDAMRAHGLVLDEDHIVYGLFSDLRVQQELQKWVHEHGRLPEAVVCANDIMAMGTCFWLQKNGYRVPEDVAVTGYDFIKSAQLCYPSITSVGRDWDQLGYNGLQHLIDKICGKQVESHISMESRFEVSESCGCGTCKSRDQRESISYSAYGRRREHTDFDIHNRIFWLYTRNIRSYEEFKQAADGYYQHNHEYEGTDFAICTEKDFWDEEKYGLLIAKRGYSSELRVLSGMKDGKPLQQDTMVTKDLIPFGDEEDDDTHIYLFVPLHDKDTNIAYVVFKDQEHIIESGLLYTWTRHMNQSLLQARQTMHLAELNNKLEKLSVTDALTGIYNRLGYEKYALPYLESCRHNRMHGAMIFADINHMKVINDKYGHQQGDIAICTVASALKKGLPEEWIVIRYGGDEFLAAGSCSNRKELDQMQECVKKALAEEIRNRQLDFELSVSVGAVWMDEDTTLSMEECFKRADQSMYQMKRLSHGEDK